MIQILICLQSELRRQPAPDTLHNSVFATLLLSFIWHHRNVLIDGKKFTYKVRLVPIEVEEADYDDEEESESVK